MMRYLFFSIFFIFFCISANGQNYYVAVVHGQVYYKDKLLKKRDKVAIGNEIRFTSKEDYIKLSGPGGLYKLEPNADSDNDSEFLVALRNELFPQVREHATVGYAQVHCFDCYFLPYQGGSFTFFEEDVFLGFVSWLKKGEEIGFLHETTDGLFYRPAKVIDSTLVLRKKEFTLKKQNGQVSIIQNSYIVHVVDKVKFLETINNHGNFDEVASDFDYFMLEAETSVAILIDEDGNEVIVEEIPKPAMVMDKMGPTRFIKKRDMVKDLKFHIKLSNPSYLYEFLENYEYEKYIEETYGNLLLINMEPIWIKLGLLDPNDGSQPDPIYEN